MLYNSAYVVILNCTFYLSMTVALNDGLNGLVRVYSDEILLRATLIDATTKK